MDWRWAEVVQGGGEVEDLEEELDGEAFEGGHLAVFEVVVGMVWVRLEYFRSFGEVGPLIVLRKSSPCLVQVGGVGWCWRKSDDVGAW